MGISRRHTLKFSLAALSAAVIGFGPITAQTAHAETKLTGVFYIPASYEALSYGPNGFVQHLKDNAAGRVSLDYYPSSQLMKADEQLPALRAGSIDLMFHTVSYITRSVPILGITGLPGIVGELHRHPERLAIGSPLFNLINEQLAKENLYMPSAGGGILEPEYICSTKASPIKSMADLNGKKLRVVSFEATKALEHYNAAAVRIPSSETYLALQRGTVDGGVFNISTIIGRSLQEQLAYCYKMPVTAYTVAPIMLRSRWDALDADAKQALNNASQWYDQHYTQNANLDLYPNKFWPKVKAAGVTVIEPSAEDVAQFDQAIQDVWAHWKKQVGEELGARAIALALGKE